MTDRDRSNPDAGHSTLFVMMAILFVVSLIVANTIATKIVMIGPLPVAAGILCFPFSYIISDVLTEVYGYRTARFVVWAGFSCLAFASLIYFFATQLAPAPFYPNEKAFDAIFSQVPRIAVGSLLAFLVGSFLNNMVMSKMKIWTQGRHLWTRTIGSTIVGEGADSLVFATVAFAGIFPAQDLLMIAFSGFLLKTAYEIIATPFTYFAIYRVKKLEGLDTYDYNISYSPL